MRRSLHLALAAAPGLAFAWVQVTTPVPATDPVSRLRADLAAGRKVLDFEPKQGYLRALLRELDIDPASQTLVFAKTSLQSEFISRKTPRALYFDAETYIGWIPGAPMIEIMTIHPTKGIVFWTVPNVAPKNGETKVVPKTEVEDCVRCHGGRVPNLFARSVHTAPSGYPRVFTRSFDMTPRLPLARRWGGWYVTGTHGGQRHMGNVLSLGTDEKPTLDPEKGANVTSLGAYFDTKRYLTPHSDIVALLVLEQQMDVQNALVRAGLLSRPGPDGRPVPVDEVEEATEPLIEALLGSGEARLTSPVAGTSEFARVYAARAPKDSQGRSLGELDLRTRLQRYPCSPLVYSPSFDALPDAARARIWRRLDEILVPEGSATDARFAHLSAEDRRALREILAETKPEFGRYLAARGR